MRIILLNGPPHSGKDTLGKILYQKHSFATIEKFAAPIRAAMCALFGIKDEEIERLKNQVMMGGKTLREWMIGFSEYYAKVYGGKKVFGELMLRRLDERPELRTVIITDSGFAEEAEVLIERYGADNVALVHIHRDGCDFNGDSRSYLELPVRTIEVDNNGSIEDLALKLQGL